MDISPGPGWKKSKEDGHFYPHFFTYADFPGARAVAVQVPFREFYQRVGAEGLEPPTCWL